VSSTHLPALVHTMVVAAAVRTVHLLVVLVVAVAVLPAALPMEVTVLMDWVVAAVLVQVVEQPVGLGLVDQGWLSYHILLHR